MTPSPAVATPPWPLRLLAAALAVALAAVLLPGAAHADPPEDPGPPDHGGPPSGDVEEDDGIIRVSGPNRFVTAAALSTWTHPDGADEVFVATGGQFADALAGAPAAALADAPVLFSAPGRLLPPVADQLAELNPETVTVFGGPAAVAPPVMDQIEDITGEEPVRVGGGDRWGTAADISQMFWPEPDEVDEVFLATGHAFADALSGAPLATDLDGPVLLTPGGQLHQDAEDELLRLGPETVTVLGGGAAVSDDVLDEVESLTGAATVRISGETRFHTAVAVSQELAPDGSDRVYLATGLGWADALAGAAAAGNDAAPALLTTPGDLPEVVADELERLDPDEVVILGGPAAITSRVEDQVRAVLDGN